MKKKNKQEKIGLLKLNEDELILLEQVLIDESQKVDDIDWYDNLQKMLKKVYKVFDSIHDKDFLYGTTMEEATEIEQDAIDSSLQRQYELEEAKKNK